MKKFEKIFLAFILFFATIAYVNAKDEVFKYDWESESIEIGSSRLSQNVAYKNGYIVYNVTGYNYPITEVTYYNQKGEELVHKKFRNSIFYYMFIVDNYIYTLNYDYENDVDKIVKYDEKLNNIKEIELSEGVSSYNYLKMKMLGVDIFSVDDEIHLLASDGILHFDKELNNLEYEEVTSDNDEMLLKKYFSDIYDIASIVDSNYFSYDVQGDKKVVGSDNRCYLAKSACDPKGLLYLLDKDDNIVLEKEFEDYIMIIDTKLIDDYIVAIGLNVGDYGRIESDVIILDMNGKIVQEIYKRNKGYFNIAKSQSGFVVNENDISCMTMPNQLNRESLTQELCEIKAVAYYLPRNITTKISGEGNINVVDVAHSGEEITYEVNPKIGYVLESIKITDKDGNVIEYNSNKFTMPASDVLIEVVFLPRNPETKDMAIISVVLITALVFGIMLINYKKLKFLR